MKKILLINDGSTAVGLAAKLALQVVKAMQAEILIVQTYGQAKAHPARVLAGASGLVEEGLQPETDRLSRLLQQLNDGFQPVISLEEFPVTDASTMADMALRTDCWMIIRGCGKMPPGYSPLDFQSLLNRLRCPLLMVPENWSGDWVRRITYMADLRYCRQNIMRYLSEWAIATQAGLSLAHFSKKGLVPIVESYGLRLFADIRRQLPGSALTFNNIQEPDIHRALDVLINGLHNDLLVLINHRVHFKEIIGERLTSQLPAGISIPILLFPL
ncbi:universal stress protein [Mucilaginibacter sp. KACC 22063]|uniref:universal stress protein n=1 Tax=Mucilaginibacter sp. KACC 22063 TaxID=3025666 RepID=UPI002365C3E5|nr:universal stress protein [Mucilaginibacter sp. KACC 22063]WDF55764.1 universal stress protein [Mucilaginibacter sp. KACC 22063]